MSELELEREEQTEREMRKPLSQKDRQSFLDKRMLRAKKREMALLGEIKEARKQIKEIEEEQRMLWEEQNLTFFDVWEMQRDEASEEELL